MAMTSAQKTDMYRFFAIAFDAAPGVTYMDQLDSALASGMTTKQVVNEFTTKAVFTALYPNFLDNATFATKLVDNVVGASASADAKAEAVADITGALDAGWTRGDVIYQVFGNLADKPQDDATWGGTATQMANQVTVAAYYTETLLKDSTDTATLQAVIANVTNTTDVSTTAAIEAVMPASVIAGTTFPLTTGVNSITGTSGADLFDGSVVSTLSPGDVLNGAGGTDTLTTVLAAGTLMPSLTSVEVINVTATGAVTLDMQTSSGYTNLNSSNSLGSTVTFNNIASVVGSDITTASSVTTLNFTDAALAGSADSLALTLNGVTSGVTITDGGGSDKLETVAITATGVASSVALTTTAVGTTYITAAGSANLTVTGIDTAVKSFDATSATGDITASLSNTTAETINGGSGDDTLKATSTANNVISGGAGDDAISVSGGSGNDTINGGDGNDTITLTTFTTSDSIDGGSGTDTLSINVAVASATALAGVSNVEVLEVTGGAAVTLAANVSPTEFDVSDATASVVTLNTGYTNATTVDLGASDSVLNYANVELTVNATSADFGAMVITGGTGTNDVLNITADSTTPAIITLLAGNTVTLIDRINIVDGGSTGEDVSITTGAYGVALTIDGSALDGSTTLDETLTVLGTSATKALNITGGGGKDSITGGTANDIIAGGAGDDSINGSAGGADSISAGDGNDTINMADKLTASDTIDGGSGTDTLIVTSLSAAALANVTNVENLKFSGTASLSSNLAFTSVDMSAAGADTLTLANGYTNATTVKLGTLDTVTNTANVALTANATGTGMVGTAVTGGTGADTLNITVSSDSPAAIAFAGKISKVDTINVLDATTAGNDLSLTLGDYATSLTVNGSALDAGVGALDETLTVNGSGVTTSTVVLNLTGGEGNDSLYGGAGNDIITGNGGDDSISGGAGIDNLAGGAGNDTFVVTTTTDFVGLVSGETVSGGEGNDTLAFATGAIVVAALDLANVTSIETITFANTGTTVGLTLTDTIFTTNGVAALEVTGANTTGAFTLAAGGLTSANSVTLDLTSDISTANNIVFGAGADTLIIDSGALSAGTVTGGAGTDTLTLTGNTPVVLGAKVTGFEVVNFDEPTGVHSVTTDTLTVASGATLTVDGSTITATLAWYGAAETNGHFDITGGSGANTLVGGSLSDTIVGGAVSDNITGGLGADVMTGGGGADTFTYIASGFETGTVAPSVVYYGGAVVAGTSLTTVGLDKITDFSSDDTIVTATGAAANLATNATGAIWTEAAGFLRGAYDSTAATFTFSTTGSDSLYVYDFNATHSTDLRGVVLVGYVDTGAADLGATGLIGQA